MAVQKPSMPPQVSSYGAFLVLLLPTWPHQKQRPQWDQMVAVLPAGIIWEMKVEGAHRHEAGPRPWMESRKEERVRRASGIQFTESMMGEH